MKLEKPIIKYIILFILSICLVLSIDIIAVLKAKNIASVETVKTGYTSEIESVNEYLKDKYNKEFNLTDVYENEQENEKEYFFIDDSGNNFVVKYVPNKNKERPLIDTYADTVYRKELQESIKDEVKEKFDANVLVSVSDDNPFQESHQKYTLHTLDDYILKTQDLNIFIICTESEKSSLINLLDYVKQTYPNQFSIKGFRVSEELYNRLKDDINEDGRLNFYITTDTDGVISTEMLIDEFVE